MTASHRPILDTRNDVLEKVRAVREDFRSIGPRVKARDIALDVYDGCMFSATLTRLLIIDAVMAVVRMVIANERSGIKTAATASSGGGIVDAPKFPEFEQICRECPNNYALPGDTPEDTIYVETLDEAHESLDEGSKYLLKHSQTELRHATALRNLFLLCRRLKGAAGETPRQIFRRHGYHV